MAMDIDGKTILEMAGVLENDELGAAIRLLSTLISTKRPVSKDRARKIARLNEEQWNLNASDILSFFQECDGLITHRAIEEAKLPELAAPAKPRRGQTVEMPIVHPFKQPQAPAFGQREHHPVVSIKSAAYNSIVELFMASDQSANTARSVLGSLLKNWPEGDVYSAIGAAREASRNDFVVNPRAWLVAYLKNNSTPSTPSRGHPAASVAPPLARKPRNIATPELTGISSTTADRLRDHNKRLRLNLENTPEE